jgi:hypothetical protein
MEVNMNTYYFGNQTTGTKITGLYPDTTLLEIKEQWLKRWYPYCRNSEENMARCVKRTCIYKIGSKNSVYQDDNLTLEEIKALPGQHFSIATSLTH